MRRFFAYKDASAPRVVEHVEYGQAKIVREVFTALSLDEAQTIADGLNDGTMTLQRRTAHFTTIKITNPLRAFMEGK